jgi:hypothetical protein
MKFKNRLRYAYKNRGVDGMNFIVGGLALLLIGIVLIMSPQQFLAQNNPIIIRYIEKKSGLGKFLNTIGILLSLSGIIVLGYGIVIH